MSSAARIPRKILKIAQGVWRLLKRGGPGAILSRLHEKRFVRESEAAYPEWISRYDTLKPEDIAIIRRKLELWRREGGSEGPLISVIVPVYNTPETWLRKAIDSVREQLYPRWELCLADDYSTAPHIRPLLEAMASKDPGRIKVIFRERNGHISEASNSALALATGDFCALLDHDDELAPHALFRMALELREHPDADILYSDEDHIDVHGRRFNPYFKPAWDPDLLLCQNYVCHLGVYRASLLREIGGFRVGMEGSQDYDLLLRASERTRPERIRHIPEILYHWRAIPGSVALDSDEKPYAHRAAQRAIQEHFDRTLPHPGASVADGIGLLHRVRFPLTPEKPGISLVVPLSRALRGRNSLDAWAGKLLAATDSSELGNIEIVGIHPADHAPSGRTRNWRSVAAPGDGLATLLNAGIQSARGSVIGVLSPQLRSRDSLWLREAVSQCLRPEIGAVGIQIHTSGGALLQSGLFLDIDGAHFPFRGLSRWNQTHFVRSHATFNVSALRWPGLFFRRETFLAAGGFNELAFPNDYFDVDFCLKLRQRQGLRILHTPFASLQSTCDPLCHNPGDSAHRRLLEEWKDLIGQDPYYNPNLSLQNGLISLAFPPRVQPLWKTQGGKLP